MAVTVLIMGLAACGDADGEIRAEIADDMERDAQGMIEREEAECAADVIVDTLGAERARLYSDAMDGDMEAAEAAGELTPEEQQQFAEGFQECDIGMM